MQYLWLATVTLLVLTNCLVRCHEFKGFDDNILFALNWPGAENTLQVIEHFQDPILNVSKFQTFSSYFRTSRTVRALSSLVTIKKSINVTFLNSLKNQNLIFRRLLRQVHSITSNHCSSVTFARIELKPIGLTKSVMATTLSNITKSATVRRPNFRNIISENGQKI